MGGRGRKEGGELVKGLLMLWWSVHTVVPAVDLEPVSKGEGASVCINLISDRHPSSESLEVSQTQNSCPEPFKPLTAFRLS